MQLKKAKKICKGMLTTFCILCPLAAVTFAALALMKVDFPRYVGALIILVPVIWMALTWAFCLVYWRCPVCGKFLGGLCDGTVCKSCDHEIDLEEWSGGRPDGEKEAGAGRRGGENSSRRELWDAKK